MYDADTLAIGENLIGTRLSTVHVLRLAPRLVDTAPALLDVSTSSLQHAMSAGKQEGTVTCHDF